MDEDYADDTYDFTDCTCEHDEGDHDFMGCTFMDCDCEGCWEE